MRKTNETALAKSLADSFPIIAADSQGTLDIVRENLGPAGLKAQDLDHITVPSGKSTTFELPTLDGGTHSLKALVGIIVYAPEQKAYWPTSIDDNPGAPPACFAVDALNGSGTPGGPCFACPWNAWGTDPKGGGGKACRDLRPLYIIPPDSLIPIVLRTPRTSTAHVRKYFVRLAGAKLPFYGVVTKVTLQTAKNQNGIEYPQLLFALHENGILSPAQRDLIKSYAGLLQEHAARPPADPAAPPPADSVITGSVINEPDPFGPAPGGPPSPVRRRRAPKPAPPLAGSG